MNPPQVLFPQGLYWGTTAPGVLLQAGGVKGAGDAPAQATLLRQGCAPA